MSQRTFVREYVLEVSRRGSKPSKVVRTSDGVIPREGACKSMQVFKRWSDEPNPFDGVGGGTGSELREEGEEDWAHHVMGLLVPLV